MHGHKLLALTTLFTVIVACGPLNADEPAALKRLPLNARDLVSVAGLNIYKYRVPMKPGTTFEIVVSEQDAVDEDPRLLSRQSFTSHADSETVDLLLSFLPRDETLRGVLLSQDEEVEYRVDCPSCSPSGMATNISLPLQEIPGKQKTLIPMTGKRSRKLSKENEICLIAIVVSQEGRPISLKKSFPRAQVSVKITE